MVLLLGHQYQHGRQRHLVHRTGWHHSQGNRFCPLWHSIAYTYTYTYSNTISNPDPDPDTHANAYTHAYSYPNPTATPTPVPITLTANGYKVKGVLTVDLFWQGAISANIDIYRRCRVYQDST